MATDSPLIFPSTLAPLIASTLQTTVTAAKPTSFFSFLTWPFLYRLYSVLVPTISSILLIHFYLLSTRAKQQIQLSRQLKIHFFTWVLCMSCTSIFFLCFRFNWIKPAYMPTDESYVLLNELTGSLHISAQQTIPLSTTFLLIDRIEAILFVSVNISRHRQIAQSVSIAVIGTSFVFTFIIIFWRAHTLDVGRTCTFSCRTSGNMDDFLIFKMLVSCINVTCGIYFVYLYFRYSNKLAIRRERKRNYSVLLMFQTELLFTITPAVLYLIFRSNEIPVIQFSAEWAMVLGYCSDGLVTSVVYLLTRNKNTAIHVTRMMISALKVGKRTDTNMQTN